MENQKTGFIPLYRSVLKKPWAKDVFLRTLWENLLLGAARQPYTANFKGRHRTTAEKYLRVAVEQGGLVRHGRCGIFRDQRATIDFDLKRFSHNKAAARAQLPKNSPKSS